MSYSGFGVCDFHILLTLLTAFTVCVVLLFSFQNIGNKLDGAV